MATGAQRLPVMLPKTYEALRAAGAPEDKARAAAEELASGEAGWPGSTPKTTLWCVAPLAPRRSRWRKKHAHAMLAAVAHRRYRMPDVGRHGNQRSTGNRSSPLSPPSRPSDGLPGVGRNAGMMEVRKGAADPTFVNALVNGEVAPIPAGRTERTRSSTVKRHS
jgi:hypothetical protein